MELASKDSLMKVGIFIAVIFFIYYIYSGSPNNVPCSASSDCRSGQYCGTYGDGSYCLVCPSCIDGNADPSAYTACPTAPTQCTGNTYCGLSNTYFDADTGEDPQTVNPPGCASCGTGATNNTSCGFACNQNKVCGPTPVS